MRPEDVPQAAVATALDTYRCASQPGGSRPGWAMREALAAAAPHLIDDAMIERAAEAYASYTYGDEPGRIDRGAALRILRAALGEGDGDA